MQEKKFSKLMKSVSFENDSRDKVEKDVKALASSNKKLVDALNHNSNKDFYRAPTSDELLEMRQWAIDYKKLHKQASKREVRKATQSHFNIKIFR